MKIEIDTTTGVEAWLNSPGPAVFQRLNLTTYAGDIAARDLRQCAFFGCTLPPVLFEAAAAAQCVILPLIPDVPFDVYSPTLYTPGELYDKYDSNDPSSYDKCLDRLIYLSYIDVDKKLVPVSSDVLLYRRMHDATVAEALDDFVLPRSDKLVAIMGGHDRARNDPVYKQIAEMALSLTQAGYFVVTGGGPGLMEAANLGAYVAGFSEPTVKLTEAITFMSAVPTFHDIRAWVQSGYLAWKAMGQPADPQRSESLGIPTWFYGHEPPNIFSTHIAKYFENSVREEGLLAIALAGVIFAEGNAGTVQEVFQDTTQNYYRTFAKKKSPMILFGSQYWNPSGMCFNDPSDKRKLVYPLLHKLATEKKFDDYLLLTDDVREILAFIRSHPPAQN